MKVHRMPGLMRPPPSTQCPRVQAGSSEGGDQPPPVRPASRPSPAPANLCSFQSAISKREDLCRTENQYLIFRITLPVPGGLCLAGAGWAAGVG